MRDLDGASRHVGAWVDLQSHSDDDRPSHQCDRHHHPSHNEHTLPARRRLLDRSLQGGDGHRSHHRRYRDAGRQRYRSGTGSRRQQGRSLRARARAPIDSTVAASHGLCRRVELRRVLDRPMRARKERGRRRKRLRLHVFGRLRRRRVRTLVSRHLAAQDHLAVWLAGGT